MTFAEINSELETIEPQIPQVDSLSMRSFVLLRSKLLTAASQGEVESKLLDGPVQGVDSPKRTFRIEFKDPVYVSTLNVTIKGGVGVRKIQLNYFGGNAARRNDEFRRAFSVKETQKVKVNSVIVAIDITATKPILECIEKLEIFGDLKFDPLDFQGEIGSFVANYNRVAEKFKSIVASAKQLAATGASNEDELEGLSDKIVESELKLKEAAYKLSEIDREIAQKHELESALSLSVGSLRGEEQALNNNIADLKSEVQRSQREKYAALVALDEVLKKKSFYNSTIEGFKAETKKNFWINFVLVALMLITIAGLGWGVIVFYEHALVQIERTQGDLQIYTIAFLRLGAGAIFLTVFYWLVAVLRNAFASTLRLLTDTRTIEAKLILARNIAETVLKGGAEGEKRNYASFLSFVILKNHFMNMSIESLAEDLNIEPDELERSVPVVPQRYGLSALIAELRGVFGKKELVDGSELQ